MEDQDEARLRRAYVILQTKVQEVADRLRARVAELRALFPDEENSSAQPAPEAENSRKEGLPPAAGGCAGETMS
jgi:hypothetical protein